MQFHRFACFSTVIPQTKYTADLFCRLMIFLFHFERTGSTFFLAREIALSTAFVVFPVRLAISA